MGAVILVLFFVFALAADFLSVLYTRYCDTGKIITVVVIAMSLETLGWIAIWFAIVGEDWRIAAVCVAGSGAGSTLGMLRSRCTDASV